MIAYKLQNNKQTLNFCKQMMEQIEYFKQIQKINKYFKVRMNSKIVYKKVKIFLNKQNKKMEKLQRKKQEN